MNSKLILLCAIAVAAAPLALAHDPPGTPKNFCEDPSSGEWLVHDYGPVASGRLVYGNEDGNLGGDCNPGFALGTPCVTLDPADPLGFSVGLCGFNPPLADWDGHNEFAFGGAWLLVESGLDQPSADPSVGAGTLYCFGAEGHHANFATVSVTDLALGAGQTFRVTSDTVDLTGTGEGCGDFVSDEGADCTGTCTVTFPAGLDGAYVVFVQRGTAGHVESDGGGATVEPTPSAPFGKVNIHRFPGQTVGYRLVSSPLGWSCVDVNTGASVSTGSPLTGPNPGVECTPPGGPNVCNSVTTGGAHSGLGTGTIHATSSCAGLAATQALTLPANAGVATSATPPPQLFPWKCTVNDSGASVDSDYWIFCTVNP